MKKLLLALLLAAMIVPFTFAEGTDGLWIGPTALYNQAISPTASASDSSVGIGDFLFGADVRLRAFSLLEGQVTALYQPRKDFGDGTYNPAMGYALLDIGVAVSLFDFVTLGAGIGPNFLYIFDNNQSTQYKYGVNAKLHADIILGGNMSLSLYGIYIADTYDALVSGDRQNMDLFYGLSFIIKL